MLRLHESCVQDGFSALADHVSHFKTEDICVSLFHPKTATFISGDSVVVPRERA